MFTGIVEAVGVVERLIPKGQSSRITIRSEEILSDCKVGDSISVNGACLTAVKIDKGCFEVDVSAETLRRTNLRRLEVSDHVNLERSVRLSDRMGGHLVMGHVDEVGEVVDLAAEGESVMMKVEVSGRATRYIVEKGSICVDGVSLTVVAVGRVSFSSALIPYTMKHTTLGEKSAGSKVNIELDIIAKYVEKLVV